jgi:hypothetical protein
MIFLQQDMNLNEGHKPKLTSHESSLLRMRIILATNGNLSFEG